jgi:hypothetical protein
MSIFSKKKKSDSSVDDYSNNSNNSIIKCPRCNVPMQKKTRDGVTIDKCNKCGGIWLDKGEIDSIAKRMNDHQRKTK